MIKPINCETISERSRLRGFFFCQKSVDEGGCQSLSCALLSYRGAS